MVLDKAAGFMEQLLGFFKKNFEAISLQPDLESK